MNDLREVRGLKKAHIIIMPRLAEMLQLQLKAVSIGLSKAA